jgi:hypothetical protein
MARKMGGRSSSATRSSQRGFSSAASTPAAQQRSYQTTPRQPVPVPTRSNTPAPVTASGPGLLGQMASTAAGVAMGSAIGHTVGGVITHGIFGSSNRDDIVSSPQQDRVATSSSSSFADTSKPCLFQSKQLTDCLQQSGNDMSVCDYYLNMLNQCRQQVMSHGSSEDLSFA